MNQAEITLKKYTEKKIGKNEFSDQVLENIIFDNCDFRSVDLSNTVFKNCIFYNSNTGFGCVFDRANLKNASFQSCDITVCSFKFVDALGLEIVKSKAQGADFSNASFVNKITSRTWFSMAYIKESNLSYANFERAVLEKCELWGNRWNGANFSGASLKGSDLTDCELHEINWSEADFTYCDLRGSSISGLDLRRVNLEGVTIDSLQATHLLSELDITVD